MAFFSATISLLLLVLSVSLTSVHGNLVPTVQCSALMMNMAGCLSFVTIGSTVDQPSSSCCNGLKTILDTNAACLCDGLKTGGSMGIKLNVTKAYTLPAACKLNVPSVSSCQLPIPPTPPPTHSAKAPVPAAAPRSGSGPSSAPAPSPSQGNHGSLVPIYGLTFVISGALVILFSLI
ncbi:PREDICTED: non-specific lipid-transfer protein-like protein At5g64080 [Camelina sativa]|uniref:Non-specific lipid-transfer protein-like protein At5g64080 n=1 Tax=Camelina sativa TaxID=90675 RepID=A0ABM0XVD6_CAMSA|nr:PREDICTED: non-specific lipid-transfer protein-like protein At5g64080 [Camelina sativa]